MIKFNNTYCGTFCGTLLVTNLLYERCKEGVRIAELANFRLRIMYRDEYWGKEV